MARPKKDDTERRIFPVAFRCTASEMERLTERATASRLSVPMFARTASLTSQVRVVQEQQLDFQARQDLRAIGNNLNQIARSLNSNRAHVPANLTETLDRLNAYFDQVLS